MAKRPALSKAEMEVARVLWELGTGTVRQVVDAMGETRKLDFSTVQTYLNRLETKGYVTSELKKRVKHFTSRVKPNQVIREAVDDFVNRLFGGASLPLLRHLIDEGRVTPEEIAQLRAMLDDFQDDPSDAPNSDTSA
ncbi:MAG: BlaI/MecI/CopY family transcriptional regulator [Planctomycetota bacterium]